MKKLRPIIALLAIVLFAGTTRGEEGNRYLFIVQTSSEMKPALPAIRACISLLFASSMNGQLQKNDTLGLWTYHRELHTGEFPMQIWTASNREPIAKTTDSFLEQQRCQGTPRIANVIPALFQVIANSDNLTVLLFTDGSEEITDTPFDAVINRMFAQHRAELRKNHIPFVVVLQTHAGKIIHCAINSAGGPVTIPTPPPPTPKPTPTPVAPPKPVAPKINPPLILDYSKPATNTPRPPINLPPAPAPAPTVKTNPATHTPPPILATTTAPVAEKIPTPLPNPEPTTTPPPAPIPATPTPQPAAVALPPAQHAIATPTAEPAPAPAITRPTTPVVAIQTPAEPPHTKIEPPAAEASPTNAPASPPQPSSPPTQISWWWWLGGGVVASIAAILIFSARRAAPKSSAITESIERRKR